MLIHQPKKAAYSLRREWLKVGLDDMDKMYIMIHFLILVDTHNGCLYLHMSCQFAKYVIPPPIQLYNILEIKMVQIN